MHKRLVLALVAVVVAPALLLAQKASYDYNKSANFATYKTLPTEGRNQVGQQLIDDRIVAAIDTQLAAKGLTKATANPDVFVIYHIAFDKQKDISTYSSGYGGGYGSIRLWVGRRRVAAGRRRRRFAISCLGRW